MNKPTLYFAILFSLYLFQFMKPNEAKSQDKIPADFCISQEEYQLYNLINDYRKALKLPALSLAKSLCYVAHQHTQDLITNHPDTSICNFHSWSDKGNWTACCYQKEIKDKACMQDKPKELTNYPDIAYEIVYWENNDATAENAFDQWRETISSRSLITNFKEWEDFEWKAVGISINKGFAIAWFGEEQDTEYETKVCGTNIIVKTDTTNKQDDIKIVTNESGRFYLIFGLFESLDEAKSQAKKYQEEGFKKVKIIVSNGKTRISLGDYATKEQANESKKELPAKYKEAWIMPY